MISKEKLVKILYATIGANKFGPIAVACGHELAADRILAALKENPVASTGESLAEPVLWQNMTAIKRHGEIVFEIHPGDEAIC